MDQKSPNEHTPQTQHGANNSWSSSPISNPRKKPIPLSPVPHPGYEQHHLPSHQAGETHISLCVCQMLSVNPQVLPSMVPQASQLSPSFSWSPLILVHRKNLPPASWTLPKLIPLYTATREPSEAQLVMSFSLHKASMDKVDTSTWHLEPPNLLSLYHMDLSLSRTVFRALPPTPTTVSSPNRAPSFSSTLPASHPPRRLAPETLRYDTSPPTKHRALSLGLLGRLHSIPLPPTFILKDGKTQFWCLDSICPCGSSN